MSFVGWFIQPIATWEGDLDVSFLGLGFIHDGSGNQCFTSTAFVRRMERRGRGVESVGIRRKGAARDLYVRNLNREG